MKTIKQIPKKTILRFKQNYLTYKCPATGVNPLREFAKQKRLDYYPHGSVRLWHINKFKYSSLFIVADCFLYTPE
jgi:hypothetical protein